MAAAGGGGDDNVVLIDIIPSPFGMRTRIALAEKGIKYEYKTEDLRNKSALLLEMNPVNKKVPVLIHNGKPICESLIQVQYIDEVWNDKAPLLPSDPYLKAHARFWGDYVEQKVHEAGRRVWLTKGEEQEIAKKELIEIYKVLEKELGEKAYFSGDHFGYIDVVLVPWYSWFYAYEVSGNFSIEAECPKLVQWAKRCFERESVSKSLPDKHLIYGVVLELKERYGIK